MTQLVPNAALRSMTSIVVAVMAVLTVMLMPTQYAAAVPHLKLAELIYHYDWSTQAEAWASDEAISSARPSDGQGYLIVGGAVRDIYDADRSFVAPTSAADDVGSAFHHTADEFVDSIMDTGLRPGSYATPVEGLSPLQAHIDLALNQAGGARNSVLTVDLAGLRAAGYEIPSVTRVTGAFNMPGGGYEMQFPYAIPPEFLSVAG